VYVAPADAPRIWRKLLDAGKEFGIMPVGLGARDTLRFEACMALYGNDIDDTTTPLEAGLGWIVKLEKESFLGRDALIRQQAAGIKRKLIGFEMKGRGIARHSYPIWSGDSEVGIVTSGTHAPTLGKPLGMGYVPVELSGVGSNLDVEIREQKVAAQVVETPFYRRPRERG
jgi:aminomethyltransferase